MAVEKVTLKMQSDYEFIDEKESAKKRIQGWECMEPGSPQQNGIGIIKRTEMVPDEKSVVFISMKTKRSYGCYCRRLRSRFCFPRRHKDKVSDRERNINARRERLVWMNKTRSSDIELTGSDVEFSNDQLEAAGSGRKQRYSNLRKDRILCFRRNQMDPDASIKLRRVISTFMSETSLHGIRQTWQGTPLRRLFFFCLVLSMACFLAHVLVETFVDYRQYPYNQQYTASINSELNFPGITVCNLNNNRLVKDMRDMGNWTAEDYYNKYYDSIHLIRCSFGNRNCTLDWMKKFISIRGEENLCLVFNVVLNSSEKEPFKVQELGILNGLSVVLALKSQDHEEVSYGVIVYLHESCLLPTEYEATFVAAPGYSTYAIINPEKMTVLGKPYRSEVCIEAPPYGYNFAQCERKCAYKYVESRCNCQLPFAQENRLRKCLVRDIPCIREEHSNFLQNDKRIKKCKCLRRCSSILYHTQISTAYRPRNKTLSGSRPKHMEINVYYQTLVMKEVKEIPKYSLDKILSQFGGQMGIFLGSSIVTVCEIMEVAFKVTLHTVRHVLFPKNPPKP